MAKGLIRGGESTSHKSGNDILYTVLETGQQVLIEGDEYHLCKASLMSDEIHEYKGKTNKEILDDIYTRSSCMVKEGEANVGDFIICKLAVRDKKKRNITGSVSEIISIMQKEHGCRVVDGAEYEKMKKGGYVKLYKTPTPKKERIYGRKTNTKGSSKSGESAQSIKFSESTLDAIKNKVEEHNQKHPDKKEKGFNYVVFDENAVTIEEKQKIADGGDVINREDFYEIAKVLFSKIDRYANKRSQTVRYKNHKLQKVLSKHSYPVYVIDDEEEIVMNRYYDESEIIDMIAYRIELVNDSRGHKKGKKKLRHYDLVSFVINVLSANNIQYQQQASLSLSSVYIKTDYGAIRISDHIGAHRQYGDVVLFLYDNDWYNLEELEKQILSIVKKEKKLKDGGEIEKRYVAEADFYVNAKNDEQAKKKANEVAKLIDDKYDNKATVNHLYEVPFGTIGNSRKVFKDGGQVESLLAQGIVDLNFYETTPEHAKEYGIKANKPIFVQNLCVSENHRLKGIGNKVLEYIENYAQKNGNDVIFGYVADNASFSKDSRQSFFCDIDMIKYWLHSKGYAINDDNNDFHKVIRGLLENGGNIGSSIPEFVAESIYDFDYLLVSEVEKYREFDRETEKKWGKHDVSLNKITELIKEYGIKEPIILQIDFKNNGLIVEGNHRLAAAKRLGLKYVPVRVIYREFGSINKHKAKKLPQFGFTKISKNEANAKEYKDGGGYKSNRKSIIYKEWSSLVNMSLNELKEFYDSEEGKKAGLTKEMADKLGIKSGRESSEWIMKMKKTPYKDWTNEMWEWADRQIKFIKRMRGISGDLYKNGEKTRKHTSLLIWGHNPEK